MLEGKICDELNIYRGVQNDAYKYRKPIHVELGSSLFFFLISLKHANTVLPIIGSISINIKPNK